MGTNETYRGIFTIPSTPFREDGEIDVPSFRRSVDFCVECKAHGLVYPVNASEFTSLSDAERFELSEVLVEQNNGRIPAIIGVAGLTAECAAKFAAHAREIGADGVIAMPPYIKRQPLSRQVIFDYYRRIAEAAKMPVFIQNYSPPVGTDMSAEFLLELCRGIDYVDYVKENGEWRILHSNLAPLFRNPYQYSWNDAPHHGTVRGPLGTEPDESTTLYRAFNEVKEETDIFRNHPDLPVPF